MNDSVYDQLTAGLDDCDFVAFFQRQCKSWMAFWGAQTSRIKDLQVPEARARYEKYQRHFFGRDETGQPTTLLQKAVASILDKQNRGVEFNTGDTISRGESRALKALDLMGERMDQDFHAIQSGMESISQIKDDPNYLLEVGTDLAGRVVTMDDLRMDTKCLVTALWVRRESGRSELLHSGPSPRLLDETSDCHHLAMLAAIDDQLGQERYHKRKKLNEIAKCCINGYLRTHPDAEIIAADGQPNSSNRPTRGGQQKTYTTNSRLAMLYKETPEAMEWTAKRCGEALEVTAEAVRKTETWSIKQQVQRDERMTRLRNQT